MQINFTPINYNINSYKPINFGGGYNVQTLTHTNIGRCLDGYIGNIRVILAEGSEDFLKVFKKTLSDNNENYLVKNAQDEIIGEMTLAINKIRVYDRLSYPEDPSHVFISELVNYSNPSTPSYKKGLTYYKDVGIRLIQIAQRRSDEAMCNGNIKLIAKMRLKILGINLLLAWLKSFRKS